MVVMTYQPLSPVTTLPAATDIEREQSRTVRREVRIVELTITMITVGMITIFASQQAGSNPQELARGISVALYCTAFGIIVAVPAVLMYRHYRRLVDDYLVDMEDQSERLLERVYDTGGRG